MEIEKIVKTKLHTVYIGEDRKVIRDEYRECILVRAEMPYIIIKGLQEQRIPFYSIENDRFNFNTSDLFDLSMYATKNPEEIVMEMLELKANDNTGITIDLEPGLFKKNKKGAQYRMCDDSSLHIVMDTKILQFVEDGIVSFDDGAAMTLFFHLINNMSWHFFDNEDDDCDCDCCCDEDDDDDCCNCYDCDNFDPDNEECHCKCKDDCDECDGDCDDDDEDSDCVDNYCQLCCDKFDTENDVCMCDKDCEKCEYPDNKNVCKEINDCIGQCGTCTCMFNEENDVDDNCNRKCETCAECEDCNFDFCVKANPSQSKKSNDTTTELPKVRLTQEQYRKFKRK
jgi:hypothetical protein